MGICYYDAYFLFNVIAAPRKDSNQNHSVCPWAFIWGKAAQMKQASLTRLVNP